MYTANFKPNQLLPVVPSQAQAESIIGEEYQPGSLPEIFQLIGMVDKKLKKLQDQTATQLTPPQFYILTLLWQADGRPFKDLALALNCTRATITGIVDTLERKGLVPARRTQRTGAASSSGSARRDDLQARSRTWSGCSVPAVLAWMRKKAGS